MYCLLPPCRIYPKKASHPVPLPGLGRLGWLYFGIAKIAERVVHTHDTTTATVHQVTYTWAYLPCTYLAKSWRFSEPDWAIGSAILRPMLPGLGFFHRSISDIL